MWRRFLLLTIVCCLLLGTAPEILAQTPHIRINLPAFSLRLYHGDERIRDFPIAIGKPSTPTPRGDTRLISRVRYPYYQDVPPGPENPLGSRWLGLAWPRYGIHGTNQPGAIGTAVSLGCIRMHNRDAEELYSLASVGTPVTIIYEVIEIEPMPGNFHTITVHPDVYNRQPDYLNQAEAALRRLGLADSIDREALRRILHQRSGTAVRLPVLPDNPTAELIQADVLALYESALQWPFRTSIARASSASHTEEDALDPAPTPNPTEKPLGSYFGPGGYATGGTITDGRDLRAIRWGSHPGYERIVLDIYHGGYGEQGPPAFDPCWFEVELEDYPYRAVVVLGGIRGLSADFDQTFPANSLIEDVHSILYKDDSGASLAIVYRRPVEIRVLALNNHGRIVIDARPKSPRPEESVKYSVRTLPLTRDQVISMYYELKDFQGMSPRFLTNAQGVTLWEAGLFASHGDAVALRDTLTAQTDAQLYVEERLPADLPE